MVRSNQWLNKTSTQLSTDGKHHPVEENVIIQEISQRQKSMCETTVKSDHRFSIILNAT